MTTTTQSNANQWALALAAARPIAYVLTSPVLAWPGMVEDVPGLPPLGFGDRDAVCAALVTIQRDRDDHPDPFDGMPC